MRFSVVLPSAGWGEVAGKGRKGRAIMGYGSEAEPMFACRKSLHLNVRQAFFHFFPPSLPFAGEQFLALSCCHFSRSSQMGQAAERAGKTSPESRAGSPARLELQRRTDHQAEHCGKKFFSPSVPGRWGQRSCACALVELSRLFRLAQRSEPSCKAEAGTMHQTV